MIRKEISIIFDDKLHKYYLGMGGIVINTKEIQEMAQTTKNSQIIDFLLGMISDLTKNFKGALIQIFNSELVISQKHIINAFYHAQKAFLSDINISNQKSIELLVYLSANRQISEAIKHFGINLTSDYANSEIKFAFLIAYSEDLIDSIFEELIKKIGGSIDSSIVLYNDAHKISKIIDFYDISDNQISIVLSSYNIYVDLKDLSDLETVSLVSDACIDIVNEKMTLISLEKTGID